MGHIIRAAAATAVSLLAAGAAAAEDRPAGLPDPITDADYAPVNEAAARLGQLLFYDPILSGNEEVSCATCHHPAFGTGDGLSLSLGDGGIGLGPKRVVDPANMPEQRVPRNAQPLFNLGAREFTVMFHDGRIEADPDKPGGLRTPLDDDMVKGFDSVLAAQTMFPVVAPDEMAGHYSESDVSQAVRLGMITGPGGAWDILSKRVAAIPAYASGFEAVYGKTPDTIGFTDISNALAAFIAYEWRADQSPFDAYLRGTGTLDPAQTRGMDLFYGEAGCSACHSGKFQSDQSFHAMAMPQIGPGKGARFETTIRDEGRYRVTGDPKDLYAFRTPSLRNVTRTGPWGHDGAYADLAAFVAAHADPVAALAQYDRSQVVLPHAAVLDAKDWRVMDDPAEVAAIAAADVTPPVHLSAEQVADLVAFLGALNDPSPGRLGVPDAVPSGLKVARP